jgi:hypothetical protein
MVVLTGGAAASSTDTAWLAGAIGPPVTNAAARTKNLWLMVLAREVEDKILAAMIKPSASAMRARERENSVGAMSSNSWVEDRNIYPGRCHRFGYTVDYQSKLLGTYCFMLTKPGNEDESRTMAPIPLLDR